MFVPDTKKTAETDTLLLPGFNFTRPGLMDVKYPFWSRSLAQNKRPWSC